MLLPRYASRGEVLRLRQICPERPELAQMVQVREADDLYFWLDAISNHAVCGLEG